MDAKTAKEKMDAKIDRADAIIEDALRQLDVLDFQVWLMVHLRSMALKMNDYDFDYMQRDLTKMLKKRGGKKIWTMTLSREHRICQSAHPSHRP